MNGSIKEFIADDTSDEDDSGLRDAIFRELGIDEKTKKRPKNLNESSEVSKRAIEKKSIPQTREKKEIQIQATSSSSHEKRNSNSLTYGAGPDDITALKRREAKLEGELKGISHVLKLLFGNSDSSPIGDVFLLRSEMKSIRERLMKQSRLLSELKRGKSKVTGQEKLDKGRGSKCEEKKSFLTR